LTLFYICLAIGVASTASNTLSSEREQDTWISLLATPLTAAEIVRGKLLGALWSMRWVGAVWLLFALSGLLVGAIHPIGFAAGAALTVIYVAFAAALGTAYSLRARSSSRALTATIGTLLVLNGLYLLACIPFQGSPDSSFLFAGVTPAWEASSWMTYEEFRNLMIGNYSRAAKDEGGAFVAGFVSAVMYGLGAAALIAITISRFDAVIDRPGTSEATPSSEKPSTENPEGLFAVAGVEKASAGVEAAEEEPSVSLGAGEDEEPAR
jgi:ABC-type transport system involved in multi-copper enzyme maturation permease subunit